RCARAGREAAPGYVGRGDAQLGAADREAAEARVDERFLERDRLVLRARASSRHGALLLAPIAGGGSELLALLGHLREPACAEGALRRRDQRRADRGEPRR